MVRSSSRLDSVFDKAIASDARRHAMAAELHYAMKNVSDEAFGYVLKVVQSLSGMGSVPVDHQGLVGQTRVVLTGENTASVAIVWSFRNEAFLSSEYFRDASGGWHAADGKPISGKWLVHLEDRYQQKLREIELTAKSESAF